MIRGSNAWRALCLLSALSASACASPAAPASRSAPAAEGPAVTSNVASTAAPPAAPLPKIRSAWATDTASELPLQVGIEAGLFAQHGLDVSAERIAGGSSKVMQVLLAGELDVAQISGGPVVDAHLAGADPVYVASHIPWMVMQVHAVPGIERIEDLRGKAVAVTRAGTASDFAARYTLVKTGLRPEVDVGIIQSGGNTETLAAMQSGNAAAGLVSPPVDVAARKLGFREIADLPSLGLQYPSDGLVVRREFLAANPETMERFLRAFIEAIARVKQDKPYARQVLAKYLETNDDEVLESGYLAFGDKYLARAPFPTASQFEPIVDFTAERDPRVRDLKLDAMLDDRLVRALDAEGFIDRLYR
jgi:NitT/TauT family transport system substrate-binding protein